MGKSPDSHIYSNMKSIIGYNNYLAHKSGNIYSKKTNRFMRPMLNQSGYQYVILQENNTKKKELVHRLIAKSFLNNPYNKFQVNHIDGNKINNNISNLEWCTQSENTIHAFKNGLMKVSKSSIDNIREMGKLSAKKVINITTGKIYSSAKEASINEGVNYKTLNGYLNNKYKNKTDLTYL